MATWRARAHVGLLLPSVVLALALTSGCAAEGVKVTRAEFGESWPLTVPWGRVECLDGGEIAFQWKGTAYTLNGEVAHSAYSDIGPIWALAPSGDHMPLQPLIDRGLQDCG